MKSARIFDGQNQIIAEQIAKGEEGEVESERKIVWPGNVSPNAIGLVYTAAWLVVYGLEKEVGHRTLVALVSQYCSFFSILYLNC